LWASTVQEQFDTNVFVLEWNDLLGRRLDPEEVASAAHRFRGDRRALTDWYETPTDLPRRFAVLLCQRANLRWDSTSRSTYVAILTTVFVAVVGAAVVVAAMHGLTLGDFAVAMLPMAPAVRYYVATVRGHWTAAQDQSAAKSLVDLVFRRSLRSPRLLTDAHLRRIQDRIFALRSQAPPVPDWLYWRMRDQRDFEMRAAVRRLAEDVRIALVQHR
jgi:hypothetical protein